MPLYRASIAQTADGELDALAGLASGADLVPYFTGAGTAATTAFTSTARGLVDDTTTTAMRATLGVTGTNTPAAHGMSAWSFDPVFASNGTLTANGTVYLTKIVNPPADSITKIYWYVSTAGVTATAGQNHVGIYSSAGTRLATTGVDADVTAAAGLRTTTISAQVLDPTASYWIGFVFNASTAPTLARTAVVAIGTASAGLATSTLRYAINGTSQTTLPASITPASNAAGLTPWWVAVGT